MPGRSAWSWSRAARRSRSCAVAARPRHVSIDPNVRTALVPGRHLPTRARGMTAAATRPLLQSVTTIQVKDYSNRALSPNSGRVANRNRLMTSQADITFRSLAAIRSRLSPPAPSPLCSRSATRSRHRPRRSSQPSRCHKYRDSNGCAQRVRTEAPLYRLVILTFSVHCSRDSAMGRGRCR